jgi:hypothetical protein
MPAAWLADGIEINLLASHLGFDATAWETQHFGLLRARMIMLIPVLASIADRMAALRGVIPPPALELTRDLARTSFFENKHILEKTT